MKRVELTTLLREIGFSCTRCGDCCSGPDSLVMLYPQESREISERTGLDAGAFSEPYPEKVLMPGGGSMTFERCLKRTEGRCIFLSGDRCKVYAARPWICRTYPFVLSEKGLNVSPCRGLGATISQDKAMELGALLLSRRAAEEKEEEQVKKFLSSCSLPDGENVLIDSTGIMVI